VTRTEGGPSGRRARRWSALALAALTLPGATCGPDALGSFTQSYWSAVCRRAFECCTPTDATSAVHAADQATCLANAKKAESSAAQVVGAGLLRFDASAASRCLKDLEGTCGAVFDPKFGRLIPCNDVFVGATPLGGPCDEDATCASGDCESQMCVVRPTPCATVTCAADQFCDGAGTCQPLSAAGGDCRSHQCAAGLTCVASTDQCATPLADGQPCTYPYDCAGSCTETVPAPAGQTGMCRPGLCQGR
jgi:hypothetical protein